jgi:hypothetical protein
MKTLQLKQMKEIAEKNEAGDFYLLEILCEKQPSFFVIECGKKDGITVLVTQKNQIRRFKNIESAYKMMKEIGAYMWFFDTEDFDIERHG